MRTNFFSLLGSIFLKMILCICCCLVGLGVASAQTVFKERRVVSLAPSTTEWIIAFGLEDRLIGVTEQCDFPPQVRSRAKVGSYLRASPERIFALRATDVVVADALPEVLKRRFESAGIRVHVFSPQRLADFPEQISELGSNLGASESAKKWSIKFRSVIESAALSFSKSKRIPRRALIFVSSEPVYLVGPAQWLSDVFRLSGFDNALSEIGLKDAFPRMSVESLANLDSKIWFGFSSNVISASTYQEKLRLLSLKTSRAVKPEIRVLDADIFQRPGPRLLDAIAQLTGEGL